MARSKKKRAASLANEATTNSKVIEKSSMTASVGDVSQSNGEISIVKFLNQVFTENKSNQHRLAAVEVLSAQLTKLSSEDVQTQAVTWMGFLSKIMESYKANGPQEFALCCHTFSRLLIVCSTSAELRRVISLTVLPKLLTSLLEVSATESEDVGFVASINLMKICIKYFGGACLSFKNKIESYVLTIAMYKEGEAHSDVVKTCVSTLAYLPCCGGQGLTGNNYSDMWANQMARQLLALEQLTSYLFSECGLPSKDDAKKSVPGQALPVVEEDTSVSSLSKAAHYLSVYLQALRSMLTTPYSWKIRVPVKHLLAIICQLTAVTPDSVVFRRPSQELQVIAEALCSLHDECMSLLTALISLCGTVLYPYTTTLCQLLNSQLQWTKAMVERTGDLVEQYTVCRCHVYDTIHSLLSQPGLHPVLDGICDTLIEHALFDMKSTRKTQQIPREKVQPPSSKRARKTYQPSDSSVKVETLRTTPERQTMASSLRVVAQILSQSAGALNTGHIKLVYDSLISLALTVQSSLAPPDCPYSADGELRLALYRCLLSSVHSYNREIGPLTHIATQLLSTASSTDSCSQVRGLCNEGLSLCLLAVQPYAPPMDQHKSSFVAEKERGSVPASSEVSLESEMRELYWANPANTSQVTSSCQEKEGRSGGGEAVTSGDDGGDDSSSDLEGNSHRESSNNRLSEEIPESAEPLTDEGCAGVVSPGGERTRVVSPDGERTGVVSPCSEVVTLPGGQNASVDSTPLPQGSLTGGRAPSPLPSVSEEASSFPLPEATNTSVPALADGAASVSALADGAAIVEEADSADMMDMLSAFVPGSPDVEEP